MSWRLQQQWHTTSFCEPRPSSAGTQGPTWDWVGRQPLGTIRLEPRRRVERALVSMVQEPYVRGISTWRVDDLVSARDAGHFAGHRDRHRRDR
jgi:hypothetical protein